MLKLLILYSSSLAAAWVSLNSLLFGLDNWAETGALMPVAAGGLGLLISARLILATVRIYLPPKNDRDKPLID